MKRLICGIFLLSSIQSPCAVSPTHLFLQKTRPILNKIFLSTKTFLQQHKLSSILIASTITLASIPKARTIFKKQITTFFTKIFEKITHFMHRKKGFFTDKYVRILSAPPGPDSEWAPYHRLVGRDAKIQGTIQEVWGIKDIRDNPQAMNHYPIANYVLADSPRDGLVYYGKVAGVGYCFHESWLRELTQEELRIHMGPPAPELNTVVFDNTTRQSGIVDSLIINGGKSPSTQIALVPLPGQEIPCTASLNDCPVSPIEAETARRACQIYCTKNRLINQVYRQLREGTDPIRTFIHGETSVGKNFLAKVLPQESGYPYIIKKVALVTLLSKWHNCEYAELKSILQQAVQLSIERNQKVVLILDCLELLEKNFVTECHGIPYRQGTDALHEFFDRQEHGDIAARNISIIALTRQPDKLSRQTKMRFFQNILLEKPDEEVRFSIIRSLLQEYNHDIDESVIQHVPTLVQMTNGLDARQIEHIFHNAHGISLVRETPTSRIIWPMVQEAYERVVRY